MLGSEFLPNDSGAGRLPPPQARDLHAPLLAWYHSRKRDLPWRRTQDPYAIWVSEIMLQQTRVETVIPYWQRWMAAFPTIERLAHATEEEVLALWQGLGYYRRGKMLLEGAKSLAGKPTPQSAEEWLTVPGIGRYTAAAIASIALREVTPLVDGNVERVYSRLYADDAAGTALTRAAWRWASETVYRTNPGDWNQALMELGATVCTPKSPDCAHCPLARPCNALDQGRQNELPTPKVKPESKSLHHRLWIPTHGVHFGLIQNQPGTWWSGLWSFPRFDDDSHAEERFRQLVGEYRSVPIETVRHVVTHHKIEVACNIAFCSEQSNSLRWCSSFELEQIAMPSVDRKIANKHMQAPTLEFPA